MRTVRPYSLVVICGLLGLPLLAQSSQLVCPILLNGHADGYRAKTILTVMNPDAQALSARLSAFSNDGNPAALLRVYPNTVSETSLELKQHEVTFRKTDGEFAALQEGWLLLSYQTATTPVVTAEVRLLKEGEACSPESVFRVPCMAADTRLTSVARIALDWSTGIYEVVEVSAYALVNPSETKTARVTLSLLNIGRPYPDKVIDIPPRQRVAKSLTELFPILPSGPGIPIPGRTTSYNLGTVLIVSDSPVACGAVDLDLRTARYSQGIVSAVGSPP